MLTLTTLSTDAFDLINKRKHCLQYHFMEKRNNSCNWIWLNEYVLRPNRVCIKQIRFNIFLDFVDLYMANMVILFSDCWYENVKFPVGKTDIPKGDGCNVCSCNVDGSVTCGEESCGKWRIFTERYHYMCCC